MLTYQDFLVAGNKAAFCDQMMGEYKGSPEYRTALDADAYDHQRNTTINNFVQMLYSSTGRAAENFVAANNKIACNLFRRLNVQRNTYSLGNGVSFQRDSLKEKLGRNFDTVLQKAGYAALKHGVAFVFWDFDRTHVFPATEFVPLWDEDSGALMAGLRFWKLTQSKPVYGTLYEADGYTRLRAADGGGFAIMEAKRAYKQRTRSSKVDGVEIVGGDNYSALPIVPLWGSSLRQSTLVGMQQAIDSYDIIRSGFANDLTDCAQIYWLVKNCGGMNADDLDEVRTRILLTHMASVDSDAGSEITAHEANIPYEARSAYLDRIRQGIYEDFGALDVASISAAAKTATEIRAAYQPMDENADDYEYCIIECVQQLLALQGVEPGDDTVPIFKRNVIANELEQVQMVVMEAPYLDDETLLAKLPNISPDEVDAILKKKDAEALERTAGGQPPAQEPRDGEE